MAEVWCLIFREYFAPGEEVRDLWQVIRRLLFVLLPSRDASRRDQVSRLSASVYPEIQHEKALAKSARPAACLSWWELTVMGRIIDLFST